MKVLFTLILASFWLGHLAHAGCDNLTAPHRVMGKVYSAHNHPKFPTKIAFYSDWSASYGSALDGHPGGKFSYMGLCNRRISVEFTPTLGPKLEPYEVLRLESADDSYEVLVDNERGLRFTQEVEE
jgi:hypothetical protein